MRKWMGRMIAGLLLKFITPDLMKTLFAHLAPIVLEMIRRRLTPDEQAKLPTEQELRQEFDANADQAIAEGKAWLEAHPKP